MVSFVNSIAENWAAIKEDLKGHAVTVVAVTKFQNLERIREAVQCGITHFGNNYVQEGMALRSALDTVEQVQWHFIGHIQSRKIKNLVDYDFIQSVDRVELAAELSKRSAGLSKKPKVLIEVNIGNEASKSGVAPAALEKFLDSLDKLEGLSVDGLMAMPPPLEPVEERARYFDEMRVWFDRLGAARRWSTLSMGTSDDYRVAVRCGATMIRLGTVLLGARPARNAE